MRQDLLPKLESNRLRVCIDYRDFEPGRTNIEEIGRGMRTSRKILLVLTPRYFESDWTSFEQLTQQNLDPRNKNARLIPLLKEQCELRVISF